MSSRRLPLTAIRAAYRILDEAHELRRTPYAARRHMAFELCRLVGARQAYYVCFDGFTPTDALRVRDMVIGGWPDEQMLRAWQKWGTRKMLREDPLVHIPTHLPHRHLTARRDQIATERQWKSSIAYESLAGPNGLGDIIITYFRRREPGRITGFSIQRSEEERRFTARERRLIALFNDALHHRYTAGAAEATPLYDPPSPLLAPRQRQVLEALLRGDSPTAAADRLAISRRTFDDHAHALYQKFEVDGRYGLMAQFVRR